MSAGRAFIRRSGAPAAAVLALVVLIAGAVVVGTEVASTRTLGRPDRAPSVYARNAIGALAPVSAEFTERRIGPQALARPERPTPETRAPGRSTPSTTAPPTLSGGPGTFPGLTPGGWVLGVTMNADRDTARAGEEIRYRMTITNTGSDDFRGRSFTLEWHTPPGTFGRNAIDQCSLLPLPVLAAVCAGQRLLFSPGTSDTSHERFNSSGLVEIEPGEQFIRDWYVQVLPSTAVGATLHNHTHLTVSIDGRDETLTSNGVVVTVVE